MESGSDAPLSKIRRVKPKVTKEWQIGEIFKLITLVECERCLWDARDGGYCNKTHRECAWQNIAEQFDNKFSVADLNAKWKVLRIQLRGYNRRRNTKLPKWRFYNALSFLGRSEGSQSQQTSSNINIKVDSDSNFDDNSSSTSTSITHRETAAHRQTQVKNGHSAVEEIAVTMREVLKEIKEQSQNALDPDATFTNYLLSELKTLSQDAAASVRQKVTSYFYQCVEEEGIKKEF